MELTTLCYIEKDDSYLMLHRVKKKNDVNHDKWIGVGGHFEEGESPEDCLRRECLEETGLTLTNWAFRGIVTFLYGQITEYMFLYTADGFTGELKDCDEGSLEWVKKEDLLALPLWEGDLIFLKLLAGKAPFFSLKLRYEGDRLEEAVLDGRSLELLDQVDEDGRPTGLTRERSIAHALGTRHRTAHVWILRGGRGAFPSPEDCEILLQKRSAVKDSFPGCYDISSAGHITAGEDFLPSALRELKEELGIDTDPDSLTLIGLHRGHCETEFRGAPFINSEVSAVFLYTGPVDESSLRLQEEEVDSVRWMRLDECLRRVSAGDPAFCIFPGELEMISSFLQSRPSAEAAR